MHGRRTTTSTTRRTPDCFEKLLTWCSRAVLNICFPYTSRAEITTAIKSTVTEFLAPPPKKNTPFSPSRIRQNILSRQLDGREPLPTIRDASPAGSHHSDTEDPEKTLDGDAEDSSSTTLPPDSPPEHSWTRSGSYGSSDLPNPENITVETLDKHMYTAQDPPLDMFVRTSGVERLSDFMLWQCHQDTHVFFLDCLWPDFDLQHFIWVLLEWQWRQKQTQRDGALDKRGSGKPRRVMD